MNGPKLPRERKPISKEAKYNLILTVINSAILLLIYFGSMGLSIKVIPAGVLTPYPIMIGQIVCVAYWVAFAVLLITYIAYNRAFTRKGITADMLPAVWSKEQKEEYILDGKRRMERSKWMLSVIIPLLVSIAADALWLFTLPLIENLLF